MPRYTPDRSASRQRPSRPARRAQHLQHSPQRHPSRYSDNLFCLLSFLPAIASSMLQHMRLGLLVILLAVFGPLLFGQDHGAHLNRFEVGGQVADIRTGCIGQKNCSFPSFGLGTGASINLNQHFAIDSNFNITPASSNGGTNLTGGRASEFLIGARAGLRARNYGFYVKAQPGFLRWSNVIKQVVFPTPHTFAFVDGGVNRFVSDMGAGFEYSPSDRIHLRTEVTDLVMHSSGSWSNNLQPTAGIYVGVGKAISWTPPLYDSKAVHPFFGRSNVALITTSVLGMTADSITTQRGLHQGGEESNPFARPLVKYGWSGQITAQALETGAVIVSMYGLHKIGQHWVERLLPICLAATHGVFAYNNAKHE
jgi:Outer membrane protein beta-barrel domain